MSRLQWSLLAVVALVVGLVLVLALRNPQAPLMPADAEHESFVAETPCMECHAMDGAAARSKNHPIGDDCSRCHGRP